MAGKRDGATRNIERGGESDKLSVEDDALAVGYDGEAEAYRACEKAATAVKFADGEGRV